MLLWLVFCISLWVCHISIQTLLTGCLFSSLRGVQGCPEILLHCRISWTVGIIKNNPEGKLQTPKDETTVDENAKPWSLRGKYVLYFKQYIESHLAFVKRSEEAFQFLFTKIAILTSEPQNSWCPSSGTLQKSAHGRRKQSHRADFLVFGKFGKCVLPRTNSFRELWWNLWMSWGWNSKMSW